METTGFEYEWSVEAGEFALFGGGFFFVWLAITVLMIVSMWKIFQKAGKQGWEAIVPIYNIIVLFQITKTPLWLIILLLIPLVNFIGSFVVAIILGLNIAKVFGKDSVFGILCIFFPYIMYPVLAFSDAQYVEDATPHVAPEITPTESVEEKPEE